MYDHIFFYETEADRPVGPLDDKGVPLGFPSWSDAEGAIWMPVNCIVEPATHDENGDVLSPEVKAPGAWFVVRTSERNSSLENEPHCLIVSDSERAAKGEPFVLISKLNPETVLGKIDPVFAGDDYPFPSGPAANLATLMVK